MTPRPDDEQLLERLSRGEVAAAEELFTSYAPYLRALVRGHLSDRLRAKYDSADVVQSVWVQVLRGLREDGWRFNTEAELRALLVTVARRRAISRARHHAPAAGRDRWLEPVIEASLAADEPRPSEVAQAGDLWQRMLRLCPPEHHEILRLRREGLSFDEIAARTGLHEGSVRRVLRRLARNLALAGQPARVSHDRTTDPTG
jgi:RNA polymerase sigma-70 factor (ECF subfamily)